MDGVMLTQLLHDGTVFAASNPLGTLLNIVNVAIGLGLVIFFHELGHFAVAKWCNVHVEGFSIGFGPELLSRQYGETLYALRLVPFGGYVKMVGQDDGDPSQLTDTEIAANPRAYTAKSVPQRMAIISAGVIMNLITGTLFGAIAFTIGHKAPPAIAGSVEPGKPAWVAGLERGDRIETFDGARLDGFQDLFLAVALSTKPIRAEGVKRDGSRFDIVINPDRSEGRPSIGVSPTRGLNLVNFIDGSPPVAPGSPAANANPAFKSNDDLIALNGKSLATFQDLQDQLQASAGQPLEFEVQRRSDSGEAIGSPEKIAVQPGFFRTLGLIMDTGPIVAIRQGSPAEKAGFLVNDKLARVNGKNIGTELDPLRLPDEFYRLAGEEVEVTVSRQKGGGSNELVTMKLVPDRKPSWFEMPLKAGDPLAIAALGVALQVVPVVLTVEPGSPAAAADVKPGASIKTIELFLPPGESDGISDGKELKTALDDDKASNNWAYAFWQMQSMHKRDIRLVLKEGKDKDGKELIRTVVLKPTTDPTWPIPVVGLIPENLLTLEKASNPIEALGMAYRYTRKAVLNIYLTLRSLIFGYVSPTELRGPIGIANAAYHVASQGIAPLLLFLSFLSANLAVLNFLPIPVLDGGHMVLLAWEGLTGRKPGERVVAFAHVAGLIFVLGLMVFVIFLDVFIHGFGTR